jgi:peptidyl-prolyl cis-trans isomerase D
MFDYVKSHKIITGIIVFLIAIPFAFFGIDFYFRSGDVTGRVADVDGTPISQQEFAQALQSRQEQLRQAMGERVDQATLDSAEVRQAVLDQLVDQQVSYRAAIAAGIRVSDTELQQVIADLPAFRENEGTGAFSRPLYEAALRSRGMSEASFEALLRRDLMVGRLRSNLAATAFVPGQVLDRLYKIRSQQREVSQVVFEPAQMQSKVKVEDADVQAYFDKHKDEFKIPEQVKVEYAVLSFDHVQKQVQVTPEAVQAYYEAHKASVQGAEERRARHILVAVASDATEEQKAAAKQRAEVLVAQASKTPEEFAALATKHSEDPGSAAEGGDLGYVPRKQMVKPFDDAMFAMKEGEIAGPVETQYGFHVIKLEGIRSTPVPSFEEMKDQAEADLRKQEANKRYAEAAEEFSNLVYEQADTLQPVAERLQLEVQDAGWVSPLGSEDAPLLNHEKVLSALFKEESIKERRNIEAVEVAPTLLLAARVTDHQPAKERVLADVRAEIVQRLTQEKAVKMAQSEGESRLGELTKGQDAGLAWSAPQMLNREQSQEIPAEAAQAVFSADTSKLPAFVGKTLPDGRYVLFRISRVVEASSMDPAQRRSLGRQVEQMAGTQSASAAVESQKQKADVKINPKALERSS